MREYPTREQVKQLRQQYPPGTRVCVDNMENDPNPIPPGTMGSVTAVDDAGTLHCIFDNGRHLGLVWNTDGFHTVSPPADSEALLEKKLKSCYEAYRAEWLTKSPEQLINLAETICSVNLTEELLMRSITEEQAAYLLQFKNPLEVVSDYWKETHFDDGHVLQDELSIAVDHIMDSGDAEQTYELEQPEEAACSEEQCMV